MFEEQVSKLRAARQLAQQFQGEVDESYDEWRLLNGDKIARAEQAKSDLLDLDKALRADIVQHYEDTGDKKPHAKLGVRVSEKPVYDKEAAVRFAFNTAPTFLSLDKKAFESYAKGVRKSAPLKFVTWEEKITATIARNLECYFHPQDNK